MPNNTVLFLYKIMLGLGAQASQNRNCITTWYIYGEYLYQNHFVINYEKGYIEHYGCEEMVPMD